MIKSKKLWMKLLSLGIVIERVEMKDVEIPPMQRAMAKEAEAIREKRLIKAAVEQEASIKLAEAAQKIADNPAALELRRLQMLTEIGAENIQPWWCRRMFLAKRLSESIQDGNQKPKD